MKWPDNKDFAFTIVDDTDNATVENIKPVYDLLHELGFKTTKTVWIYPSRDHFTGETLQDKHYLEFVKDLESKGFEIGMHNVGSGRFTREEIKDGIQEFKSSFPKAQIHINHSSNPDNIYWGAARFNFFAPLYKLMLKLTKSKRQYFGNDKTSELYWSDIAKQEFKYIRNLVFNSIDTLKVCPKTPYKDRSKPESNYWFSSSDGHTFNEFMELTKPANLKQLIKNGGG